MHACSPQIETALQMKRKRQQRHRRLSLAAIAFIAVPAIFFNLDGYKTLQSHEVYAMVPAREMMISGDWIVPRIAQVPRLRKPPLAYWVIAGSAQLMGGINETSARLPAALSTLGLAALMGFWCTRWYGRRVGYLAAFMQLTTIYCIQFARKAEIDMLLTLCTTSAMCVFALGIGREKGRIQWLRWLAIYALISISWMAKFHFGPTMVMLPIVLYWILRQDYRSFLNLLNPVGLVLLSLALFVWPTLLLQRMPDALEVWKEQTVGRAIGHLGSQPIWYYVPHLLFLTLPWTPAMIAAVPDSWIRAWKKGDLRHQFLWIWFLSHMFVLHVSANKNSHYMMSTLPMLTIIGAPKMLRILEYLKTTPKPFSDNARNWLIGIMVGGAVGVAIGASLKYPFMSTAILLFCVVISFGMTAIILLFSRGRFETARLASLGLMAVMFLLMFGAILPHEDHRISVKNFVELARQDVSEDDVVCAYCMDLTSAEFYIGAPVQRAETIEGLKKYYPDDEQIYLVTYEDLAPHLQYFGEVTKIRTMQNLPDHAAPRHAPLVLVSVRRHSEQRPSPTVVASESERKL